MDIFPFWYLVLFLLVVGIGAVGMGIGNLIGSFVDNDPIGDNSYGIGVMYMAWAVIFLGVYLLAQAGRLNILLDRNVVAFLVFLSAQTISLFVERGAIKARRNPRYESNFVLIVGFAAVCGIILL